ncbi:MAG TPA: hypothetical protein VIH25_11135 [Steroidobacteraceae bacterium]
MRHDRTKMFRLAALAVPAGLLVAAYALAGGRSNCWMTGGGSIFAVQYGGEQRITHGFVLHCDPRNSDNLQVNDHGTGWGFHLGDLTSAICIDDPAIDPNPPDASFDTFVGEGTGICRNVGGESRLCTAQWTFTDGGERGGCIRDTAIVNVEDDDGNLLISVSGEVDCGNHQAHSQ